MRSMSKVGRSRSIPAGAAPKRTVCSLTRAQMYRPQIGLKLGMEKKSSSGDAIVDENGVAITDENGNPITS